MDENLLLTLLHNNARMDVTDLAMALNETEDNVVDTISQLEKDKVICGYHTIINWDRTNVDNVMALIQLMQLLNVSMVMIVLLKRSMHSQK